MPPVGAYFRLHSKNGKAKTVGTSLHEIGFKRGDCPRIEAVARGSHFESIFSII